MSSAEHAQPRDWQQQQQQAQAFPYLPQTGSCAGPEAHVSAFSNHASPPPGPPPSFQLPQHTHTHNHAHIHNHVHTTAAARPFASAGRTPFADPGPASLPLGGPEAPPSAFGAAAAGPSQPPIPGFQATSASMQNHLAGGYPVRPTPFANHHSPIPNSGEACSWPHCVQSLLSEPGSGTAEYSSDWLNSSTCSLVDVQAGKPSPVMQSRADDRRPSQRHTGWLWVTTASLGCGPSHSLASQSSLAGSSCHRPAHVWATQPLLPSPRLWLATDQSMCGPINHSRRVRGCGLQARTCQGRLTTCPMAPQAASRPTSCPR